MKKLTLVNMKFTIPIIFDTLLETVNSAKTLEETDGFVTDVILQIVNLIANLLKNNIDSLAIPTVIKSALRKLKSLFVPQIKDKEEGKIGDPEPENAKLSNSTRETSDTSGDGREEQ